MEGKVRIGKVSRLHGYKGEVSLKLEKEYIDLFSELEHVFLKVADKAVPFFIDNVRFTPQGYALVFFDGVDDQAEAERIRGTEIWIDEKEIPETALDPDDPNNLLGYNVVDKTLGELGQVDSIVEYPGSTYLVVAREEGEILIPMHPDILTELDHKTKSARIEAPEGLIDLNLK